MLAVVCFVASIAQCQPSGDSLTIAILDERLRPGVVRALPNIVVEHVDRIAAMGLSPQGHDASLLWESKGDAHFAIAQYKKALDSYKHAFRISKSSRVGLRIVEMYSEGGQVAEAAEQLKEIRQLLSKSEMQFCEGIIEFGNGRYRAAAESLERAVSLTSERHSQAGTLIWLVKAYLHEKDIRKATSKIDQYFEIMPFGDMTDHPYILKGHCLTFSGRSDDAMRCYTLAYRINPKSKDAVRSIASLHRVNREIQLALVFLCTNMDSFPDSSECLNEALHFCLSEGLEKEGLAISARAKMGSKNHETSILEGELHLKTGDLRCSAECYERSLTATHRPERVLNNLVLLYGFRNETRNIKRAIDLSAELCKARGAGADWVRHSVILANDGRFEEAIRTLEIAEKFAKSDEDRARLREFRKAYGDRRAIEP